MTGVLKLDDKLMKSDDKIKMPVKPFWRMDSGGELHMFLFETQRNFPRYSHVLKVPQQEFRIYHPVSKLYHPISFALSSDLAT